MQQIAQELLLSATDLVAFLECEHLSALDLRVATGTEVIEQTRTDPTELVARKGGEHEHPASVRHPSESRYRPTLPSDASLRSEGC